MKEGYIIRDQEKAAFYKAKDNKVIKKNKKAKSKKYVYLLPKTL